MITVYNYAILNYQQNRQPAIHGADSSLQSMSALRGSNSVPLTLYARCYPMRYRALVFQYIKILCLKFNSSDFLCSKKMQGYSAPNTDLVHTIFLYQFNRAAQSMTRVCV